MIFPLSLVPVAIVVALLAAVGFYMKFSADRAERRDRH